MSRYARHGVERSSLRARIKKWIAGASAAALGAGLLVVAGFGVDSALAGAGAPGVSVAQNGTYLAGEDLSLSLTFESNVAAGDEYNLSAGVVLPQGITVVDSGTLGAPVVYTGRALPLDPVSPAARVQLPGNYSMSAAQCAALGLEPWTPGQASGKCVVPDGMQYLVFQNISDLPEGASATHSVTLRPDALVFPVGSRVELDVTAFTSEQERYIPVFPGSTGVAAGSTHTSAPGFPSPRTTSVLVNALRLEKSEPSPESELLRGVHNNSTTYTLRVWHTGEGDIDDVTVTDFIPAGLEYLGLGSAVDPDRTTNANGTQGLVEYPGAPRLDSTPAPAGSTYAGTGVIDASRNAANMGEETVTTRVATAADAAAHPGVVAGDVYTVVSWNIGELLKTGLASYSILDPVAQTYDAMPGTPGFFEIRYRAAVPLFENTVDFDGNGNQPTADGGRHQIANLDNNRGASTRHGSVQTTPGFGDDGDAKSYTNVATAAGVYNGEVADEADRILTDTDTETIDAVDVRLLKSVDDDEFTQGGLATYTLDIRTSEYTSADLGAGGSGAIRPNRLVDELGDGICPVFPAGVAVTPGASTAGTDIPRLVIGNPNPGGSVGPDLTAADWTAALGTSLASVCGFPSSRPGAALTGAPGATTLTGIAYNPANGHFYLDLNTAALGANSQQVITYTALQNTVYSEGGGEPGATSSGDTIVNTAELMMTTQSIPGLDGVTSSGTTGTPGDVADGTWRAWDDSDATLHARLSELSKHVLKRSAGVPERDEIAELAEVPESEWVKTPEENEPFAVGDQVWYRIKITPPAGADVRNPKFTDFLPVGVEWDPAPNGLTGRPENMWIVPSSPRGIGACQPSSDPGDPIVNWLNTFAEFDPATDFDPDGNILTFNLGADDCFPASGNTDRFLPLDTTLEIYLKVTVVDAAAFATVDLPQNLAKYQQNNVDGDIFFLRDMAEIEVDGGPRLLKGIRSNTNADSQSGSQLLGYYPYNSNVDGTPTSETVVQGDEVTFRLDVSAPRTGTTNYQVWDALPVGIKAADVNPGSYTAADVNQIWVPIAAPNPGHPGFWEVAETPVPATSGATTNWTADVYDYDPAFNAGAGGYPGAPADVNDHLRDEIKDAERSIVVWSYSAPVLGSIAEDDSVDPAIPAAFRGITLGYTVVVPDGTTGSDAAELTQRYQNDASIVQFAYRGNDSTPTTPVNNEVIVNGTENLADERHPAPGSGVFELEDEDNTTSDPSRVYVLGTDVDKKLVNTEIGPSTPAGPDGTVGLNNLDANNGQTQIVQGERATFEYSVTIPAKTTVRNAVLADDGRFTRSGTNYDYEFVNAAYFDGPTAADTITCGALATDFRCADSPVDGRHGVLTFPDEYTNSTSLPQTFRVQVTVWMKDRDANNPAPTPDLTHGWTLTNTARFGFDDPNDPAARVNYDDTAQVQYIDPNPRIVKSASPNANVAVNTDVVYTLQVHNPNLAPAPNTRPKSYDNVVLDTVPAGLIVDPASFRIGTTNVYANATAITAGTGVGEARFAGAGVTTGLGGTIEWSHARSTALQEVPTTVYLFYTAKIDPTTGAGSTYRNDVELTGQTLPSTLPSADTRRGEREATGNTTITATTASIAKGVRVIGTPSYAASASAPVGQTVQYKVDVTLNANINYYDVHVTDILPAGIVLQGTPQLHMSTGGGAPVDVTADWTRTPSGQTSVWTYTAAGAGGDLLANTQSRVLTITYDALTTTSVPSNGPLSNTARFQWATQNGGTLATGPTASANVTILNPNVTVGKQVKLLGAADGTYAAAKTGNPDQQFTYRVRVTNSGNTPAHNVSVADVVQPGIRIDLSQAVFSGATFSPNAAALENGLGGTITWTGLGPITNVTAGGANVLDLVYNARFVGSADLDSAASPPAAAGTGVKLDNTASIARYESFGSGAWVYTPGGTRPDGSLVPVSQGTAGITPLFPRVVPVKSVTNPVAGQSYGIAYAGQNFNWTLTANNTGVGTARDISVSDVLPVNWEYVGNARISVNGGAFVPLTPAPTVTTDAVTGGDQQTLLWPTSTIAGAAATPLAAGGSFVITFDARPTTAALTTPGTGVLTRPHTNTLSVTATDTNGASGNHNTTTYAGPQSQATAYIAEADLALTKTGATQPIKAGQSNSAAWTLTVRNNGPDTAAGSITVTDTTDALPAGVTVTGASGTGWSCTTPVRAGDGTTTFGCERLNPNETLASGASFPVINVAVSVAADQPAVTGINNTGLVVPGATHDPNYVATPGDPGYDTQNNRSRAPISTTTEADLQLVKTVTSPNPIPAGGVVVGSTITWNLTVTNLGPSDSQSPSGNRIRITDQVPAGITGVANPSNASWEATLNGSAWPAGGTATAGDQIEWSYIGDTKIPSGGVTSVSLTGTILTSHVGNVVNTARVHPGPTTDPDYGQPNENNTSTVTTPTNSATVLDITKTRVVPDGAGGWRQADPTTYPEDAFVAGEPVNYRITIANTGAADARNVRVVDETPATLTFKTGVTNPVNISGTWTRSSHAAPNTHWDVFSLGTTLPSGESRAFVVIYDTAPTIVGSLVNWAEVTADNSPSDRDDDSTGSSRIVDLGIEKTHTGTGPFTPGTEVTYTLVVTNYGPSATNGPILIEDALPAGMSYVANSATVTVPGGTTPPADPNPAIGGTGDRELTWNLLAPADTFDFNATITVTFRALIDPSVRSGVPLTNTAEVTGTDVEPDPDPHANTDTDTVTTTGTSATMTIDKQVETTTGVWDETAQKVAGTLVKWRVTVTNAGPSAAPVTFSDTLPTGLSFVSMSGTGWDCPAPGGTPSGSCTYTGNSGLHPVGTANASVIEIVALAASNLPASNPPGIPALVNTGTIRWSDDLTPGVQTQSDTASITIRTEADLGLVKTAVDPADDVTEVTSAVAGEQARYRIDVTNYGPSDAAPDLVVTDTLPLGVSYVGPAGTTATSWDITAAPYDPAVPQVVTFTRVAGGVGVGLPLSATTAPPTATAAPVILFDVLLEPSLQPTDPAAAPPVTPLINTATVTSGTPEPAVDPHPNTDTAPLDVVRSTDLAVVKSHPTDVNGQVHVGDPLDFTIQVTNNGPSISSGFTVTDTVPAGLEVTSTTGPVAGTSWTIDSITLVDPLDPTGGAVVVATYAGTLGVTAGVDDEADPLVISTLIHESAHGTVPNHVEITSANEPDPDTSNNEWSDPLDVTPVVKLVVEKSAVGQFQVGKVGTYRITVENQGPHDDPGPITVTDVLPNGLAYHSSPSLPAGVSMAVSGKTVTWTLTGGLAVGDTAELTLKVNVLQAAYPQVTNTVVIDSPADLTPDSVLSDDATVPVKALDPLSITGASAVGYLAMLAALLMLGGAVGAARGRREVRGVRAE